MATLRFNVTGMTCAACSARVEAAIRRLPGVSEVAVGLLTNSARVEGNVEPEAVVAAVERAGYRATLKSVSDEDGKRGISPNDKNGFDDNPEAAQEREASARRRRTVVAASLLIPLLYSACGVGMFGFPLPGVVANPLGRGLLQLLLTAAILGVERRFFVDGWASLRRGAPTMDALVAVGSGASFVFSVGALFAAADAAFDGDAARATALANGLYFESAAMILVFVGFGKMLDTRAKGRATSALTALARLAPETAAVERGEDGVEERVPTDRVRVGDVFLVRPGERIPVDGVVLDGASAVDESALTGESVPVEKGPESDVSAGTLNASGFLRCRATRVGEDATLGQIVRLTAEAAATKAPIARAADRIAAVFVPTVLTLAAATTGAWLIVGAELGFAVARGVAVLVVSCPCALGLATPAAIAVASGVGARRGILFKTAEALENAGKTAVLTLDKTGTLTVGKPNVVAVVPAPGVSEAELIDVAAALERKSEHPLARAVVEYAAEYWEKLGESKKTEKTGAPEESPEAEKSAEIADFRAVVGAGLTGTLGGALVVGGKRAFVAKAAAIPAELTEAAERFAADGRTSLFFACGGKTLGVVAVSDVEKADAADAVAALKRLGVRVCVATGDERRVARALGRRVG
ncbi:MAG: cation-translocating P-type ATPase, partial [Thermoguttaceae bacterium]|nr:cation-translocating P-type ATPase [Thermoguttaceae bacterium]